MIGTRRFPLAAREQPVAGIGVVPARCDENVPPAQGVPQPVEHAEHIGMVVETTILARTWCSHPLVMTASGGFRPEARPCS